jgi:dolichol-phosphate mannosyltransferase
MRASASDSLVVVPTYNEAENLEELVPRLLAHDGFDVFVVDDNSPDGTGLVAEALAHESAGRVTVVHRPCKRGLGPALSTGFRYALGKHYRYVFQMDADLSHDPIYLPEMKQALEAADVVIGSRYVPGGRVLGWPAWRQALSQLGSLYSRLLLGLPIRDPTGGFKGFRREALATIMPPRLLSRGFAVQVEVNYRCFQACLRVVELPTAFADRSRGRSKMSLGIALEALLLVARLRLSPPAREGVAASRH